MLSSRQRLSRIAALSVVASLVVAPACTGFFVNQPNSIAVTQSGSTTLSVAVGTPAQLTATATYSSGTKDVTKSASWQSSTACATVNSTGKVTGVGADSGVTITATLGGISGTITGSITGGSSQVLTISPPGPFTLATSSTQQFTATDSSNNDVTNSATWTSGDTSILAFSAATHGLATFLKTGTTTVSASTSSSGTSCASGSESVTIQ